MVEKVSYEAIGNIALVKFSKENNFKEKKKFAEKILKTNKSVKTVLEKVGKFKGRLRKQKTQFVAGEKTKEALYRENGCVFRFNIDSTYFSPRLSNERKEIATEIRNDEEVLVMFAGVAPFSIVIAKISGAKIVYSNEINREANKYGKLNAELNHLKKKIIFLDGDIKKVTANLKKKGKKFDVIVMPRPQLRDKFLKEAFSLSKKGTRVYYYDFCKEDEIKEIINRIKNEASRYKHKIKILKSKKAGEIAPYRYRIRVDFKLI